MSFDLIRVCVFGRVDPEWCARIKLRSALAVEAAGFDIHAYADDADLTRVLAEVRPQVILSFGKADSFRRLWLSPLEIRRRWVNIESPEVDPAIVADQIMATFIANATAERFAAEPLISVFTPTHRTGAKIERPLRSLLGQTYPNWEWVIYDDSPDEGKTFEQMSALCLKDHRIIAHRSDRPCGCIGEVKRRACGLTRGAIMVELDHDDELTPEALASVAEAHRRFPDAGFFYTDCAEIFENGENAIYPDGWGFGYGSYRDEFLNGHLYKVSNYPDINSKTIRHIVGVPNHLRAWTRKAYFGCGGHNPEVHVCDDYELLIRTFLHTRMVHIKRFGYVQYYNNTSTGNTHRQRNAEIQRLVRYFRDRYNTQIHERLLELGVDDYIWREGGGLRWDLPNPKTTPIANYLLS